MAAGLGLLRLEPRAFWAMTVKELAAALRSLGGPAGAGSGMRRVELQGLMTRYPDRVRGATAETEG